MSLIDKLGLRRAPKEEAPKFDKNITTYLDDDKFMKFLENYPDFDSLSMDDNEGAELATRYEAFKKVTEAKK